MGQRALDLGEYENRRSGQIEAMENIQAEQDVSGGRRATDNIFNML